YEETLSSLDTRSPIIVLGAYGGAARDVAIDLGLIGQDQEVPYLGEIQPQYRDARARIHEARARIPERERDLMAPFVLREDCEDLALDVVSWIDLQLQPGSQR